MNVTVLIADDEPVARAGLRDMLAAFEWVTCVGDASNGPAAVGAIDERRPDVVFLDIQMPGLIGTDVMRRIAHRPYVIFTTAFAQHAVTAFELSALDYLLKPFGPIRLAAAMQRVRGALGDPASPSPVDRMTEAFNRGPMHRLFVRSGTSIVPVAIESVAWFEASGDYVVAHTAQAKHVLHLSLSHLEARLEPARFVRIHRTHIVNLDAVKGFRRLAKGQLAAELRDGTRLTVSRARATEVRKLGV